MFDYDKDRMTGKQESIATSAQEAILNICLESSKAMKGAGERACLLSGLSIAPLAGISFIFGHHTPKPGTTFVPTVDDLVFGALYVVCAAENHEDGIIMGYSLMHIKKTLEMFRELMGRDYPVQPALKLILDGLTQEAVKNTPDHLKKFIA